MVGEVLAGCTPQESQIVRGLLDIGAKLYACRDRREMLETILSRMRWLTGAEAGSIYLVQGDRLRFMAVQNDRMNASEIARHLLGKEMPISSASLAGFVALTGREMNIPDCESLSPEAPFRINRDLDAETGYRVMSILAIPLKCPDGQCVGVLQLFNRLDADGRAVAFQEGMSEGMVLLVTTAAIAVHNAGLQEQLRQVHLNTILRLSTIAEYRDADTSEHIERVSRTCHLIAGAVGMDADGAEVVRYASPMHDVGKVAIPDVILLKPGHLTPEQHKVMERHTVVGAEIFDKAEEEVLTTARAVALYHHERWDGKGYPHGLKEYAIPLPARITSLADVFDAVVSRRCYKDACPLDVALDIIDKETGEHFDPEVVKAFFEVLDDVLDGYPALKAA